MQFKQSKFQLFRQDGKELSWANYTMENHLGYNAYIKPTQIAQDAVQFIATTKSLSKGITPLMDLTKGQGKTITIDTREWEWKLYGTSCRPAIVIENVEDGNETCGIQFTKFKLKLDSDYYVIGDVLAPRGPKQFQARIQEEPIPDGNGYIYTLALMTDDPTFYLPSKFLQPGEQWKKMFSTYSEARVGAGSTMYNESPYFIMRSWLTHTAKKYRITGDAARARLVVRPLIVDSKTGKTDKGSDMWYHYAEAVAEREWKEEQEYILMYSRSTKKVIDEQTGLPVNQGPGLQELMEEGNVHYYNNFTIRLVENFLRDIFFNRVKPENRNIYMLTGQIGLEMFDKAVKNIVNGNFSDQAVYYIDDSGNKVDRSQGGTLSYGNYYKAYNMQWGTLIPVWFPLYDDLEKHTEINPDTGYPTESQRFTFLNLGLGDGMTSDNIMYVERKDSESFGYMCGTYTPYGPNKGNMPMSYPGDYFDVYRTKQLGIQLTDPKLTGELIFNMHY